MRRERWIAVILAFFFGWFGAHKFYLGRPWQGLLYFFFAETMIPFIIGLIEAIRYCFMSEWEFHQEYG